MNFWQQKFGENHSEKLNKKNLIEIFGVENEKKKVKQYCLLGKNQKNIKLFWKQKYFIKKV